MLRNRITSHLSRLICLIGLIGVVASAVVAPGAAYAAARETWPPFVLVTGLLLIGFVANEESLFEGAAGRLASLPGGNTALLVASMGLVAAVTAVLNLDTSVAFLTPILVRLARQREADEIPFLYGCAFMSNSASLLLPGSNLTNLLVLAREHVPGHVFARRMFPGWVAAVAITLSVVVAWNHMRSSTTGSERSSRPSAPPLRLGRGLFATLAAISLILFTSAPALPVLAVGGATAAYTLFRLPSSRPRLRAAVDLLLIGGLFGFAVALGALARTWDGPVLLMAAANRWQSAGIGSIAAIIVNNLPAAVLLASPSALHPRSLLLGLNLGPNLAVTGSLSAVLWFNAARSAGAKPSVRTFSKVGLLLAPLSIAAALLALLVFAPGTL